MAFQGAANGITAQFPLSHERSKSAESAKSAEYAPSISASLLSKRTHRFIGYFVHISVNSDGGYAYMNLTAAYFIVTFVSGRTLCFKNA